MSNYYVNTTSSNTNTTGMWTTTTGTYVLPVTYPVSTPQPARDPTPLEWLDAEIEATCRLARLAA